MAQQITPRLIRATDSVKGIQKLVLEMPDGSFAIGHSKRGKQWVDGAQRWTDSTDAYCEALDRINALRGK